MDSSLVAFLIGVGIPLLFCVVFWKQLRDRRNRAIQWIKSRFNKKQGE
ncbi:MAG: hypothetical protein QM644_03410 [Mobilitalea sp.]